MNNSALIGGTFRQYRILPGQFGIHPNYHDLTFSNCTAENPSQGVLGTRSLAKAECRLDHKARVVLWGVAAQQEDNLPQPLPLVFSQVLPQPVVSACKKCQPLFALCLCVPFSDAVCANRIFKGAFGIWRICRLLAMCSELLCYWCFTFCSALR